MAASITRSYTFSDGTTAYGSQVETEIGAIVTMINNLDAGTTAWTSIKVAGDITNTGSGKGLICTTPDGTKTYRLAIDNDGSITSEQQ